jgi:hypothetical protein
MDGFTYGEKEPVESCPYCEAECQADWVDIGVGYTQAGPFHCTACGASQIGGFDDDRELTEAEKTNGWYAPGQPPSDKANVIHGRIVGHTEMADAYYSAFANSGLWFNEDFVKQWWVNIRK